MQFLSSGAEYILCDLQVLYPVLQNTSESAQYCYPWLILNWLDYVFREAWQRESWEREAETIGEGERWTTCQRGRLCLHGYIKDCQRISFKCALTGQSVVLMQHEHFSFYKELRLPKLYTVYAY